MDQARLPAVIRPPFHGIGLVGLVPQTDRKTGMTLNEAIQIGAAIHLLETGRTQQAIDHLRAILASAGHPPPPVRLVNGKDPRGNGERP